MIQYRSPSGGFEDAIRYGHYYFTRCFPHPFFRNIAAWFVSLFVGWRQGRTTGPPAVGIESALADLKRQGFAKVLPLLDHVQLDDIKNFLRTAPVAKGAPPGPVDPTGKGIKAARYSAATILSCPHLLALINSPFLLGTAERYFGCKPTIAAIGLRWSFPSPESLSDVEVFHRDNEDWRFLKVFVYLTDVDEGNGPHEFVLGSQTGPGRLRQRPYLQKDIEARYGASSILPVMGPQGTTFIENTWGIHRGRPPTTGPRLMFDVMYSLIGIPIYQYEPVRVANGDQFDRYVNRHIVAR